MRYTFLFSDGTIAHFIAGGNNAGFDELVVEKFKQGVGLVPRPWKACLWGC